MAHSKIDSRVSNWFVKKKIDNFSNKFINTGDFNVYFKCVKSHLALLNKSLSKNYKKIILSQSIEASINMLYYIDDLKIEKIIELGIVERSIECLSYKRNRRLRVLAAALLLEVVSSSPQVVNDMDAIPKLMKLVESPVIYFISKIDDELVETEINSKKIVVLLLLVLVADGSSEITLVRDVIRIFADTCCTVSYDLRDVKLALQYLSPLLSNSDSNILVYCCEAIEYLIDRNVEATEAVLKTDVVLRLVRLLESSNIDALRSTLKAIHRITTRQPKQIYIVIGCDGVKALVNLLKYNDDKVQYNAVQLLLQVISRSPEQTETIIKLGGVPQLMRFVKFSITKYIDVIDNKSWTMEIKLGVFSVLILLVLVSRNSVKETLVGEVVRKFSKNRCTILYQLEHIKLAMQHLDRLLSHNDGLIVFWCCEAIEYLSVENVYAIETIVNVGMVPNLIRLLKTGDPFLFGSILRVILNITKIKPNQIDIVIGANGVKYLIDLLKSNYYMTKYMVLELLFQIISRSPEEIRAIIKLDAVPMLMELVKSSTNYYIEYDDECRKITEKYKDITALLLLAIVSYDTKEIMLVRDVVRIFAEKRWMDSYELEHFKLASQHLSILLNNSDSNILAHCCEAVGNLSNSIGSENIDIIVANTEIVPKLVRLLETNNVDVLRSDLNAIYLITIREPKQIDFIIDNNGVKFLVNLLKYNDNSVQNLSSQLLSQVVTRSPAQTEVIIALKGVPPVKNYIDVTDNIFWTKFKVFTALFILSALCFVSLWYIQ